MGEFRFYVFWPADRIAAVDTALRQDSFKWCG